MEIYQGQIINEKTIWSVRQNHPEMVIQDCVKEIGLTEEQAKRLRFILMKRGINKWLYCRLKFIKLKHWIKEELNKIGLEFEKDRALKWKFNFLNKVNMEMQDIAKTPRWVEWGTHVHKNMKKNEEEIKIKGRHC